MFLPPSWDSRARGTDCQLSARRTSNSAEIDPGTTPHRAFLPGRKSLRGNALELLHPGEKPLCARNAQKTPKTRWRGARNSKAHPDLGTIAKTFLESPPGSYEQGNRSSRRKSNPQSNFGRDSRHPPRPRRDRFLVYGEKSPAQALTVPLTRLCGTPSRRRASRGLCGMPTTAQ